MLDPTSCYLCITCHVKDKLCIENELVFMFMWIIKRHLNVSHALYWLWVISQNSKSRLEDEKKINVREVGEDLIFLC